MAIALVVVQPFASYAKGDRITDPGVVADLLLDHHHRVVKITVEDQSEDRPAPAQGSS